MGRVDQIALMNPHEVKRQPGFYLIQPGIEGVLSFGSYQVYFALVRVEIENFRQIETKGAVYGFDRISLGRLFRGFYNVF